MYVCICKCMCEYMCVYIGVFIYVSMWAKVNKDELPISAAQLLPISYIFCCSKRIEWISWNEAVKRELVNFIHFKLYLSPPVGN